MSSKLHHRVRQHSVVQTNLDISSCCSAKICSGCRATCTKVHQKQCSGIKKHLSCTQYVYSIVQYVQQIWFICGKYILFCQNAQALASSLCDFFFPEVDDDYLNYFSCKRSYLTIYTLYMDHSKVLPEYFLLHCVLWMLPLTKIMHVAMHAHQMFSGERM